MVMRSLDFVLCAQFGRNLTLIRDSVNTITPIATKLGVPPEFFQVVPCLKNFVVVAALVAAQLL